MNSDQIVPSGATISTPLPDTLGLAGRAGLALNALGGCIDPKMLTMYGSVHYFDGAPHLSHWASADTLLDPKFLESFTLMRVASGSRQHEDLEARYRAAVLGRVDNGLYWDRYSTDRPWRNSYAPAHYGQGKDEDFCTLPGTGRLLRTLIIWRELFASDQWDGMIQSLMNGMRRILVCKDDYGYYPEHGGWGEPCAYPRSGWLNTDEAQGETDGGEGSVTCMQSHQLYAAAKWYALTGNETARDLADRLARYVMLPRFWGGTPDPDIEKARAKKIANAALRLSDPAYRDGVQNGHWYSHFHARAITLRGLLEYARAVGDLRVMEFVRRSYEFTQTQGIARIGWVNCWPASSNGVEGCALGDLVGLGVRLSDMGLGDFWDDVDAVVRNQLVEQQLTDGDRLRAISRQAPHTAQASDHAPGEVCMADVIERSLGSWAGAGMPNAIVRPWVMHCCTSNASQGLYYAWEASLRETGQTAEVNLLINRAGKLLDIESHLPHEGKVVLRNRSARKAYVRLPYWVARATVRVSVGGKPTTSEFVGNRLALADMPPGKDVEIAFAVPESSHCYRINYGSRAEAQFGCEFRGSTMVRVSPDDQDPCNYPLYRREYMRSPQATFVTSDVFHPRRVVLNW